MDLAQIFIHDTTWSFAAEVILRSIIMFVLIIVFLRLTGKRGVRQLSIFEVAILLALGSIAGDPMFEEDLPILQALIVMSVVIGLYRVITWLMMKYQPFEDLIEGKALYIVEDGELVLEKIKQGKMSHDEFFSEMRQQNVEHLGQVRVGLLESDGKFSILFYPPYKAVADIKMHHLYACTHCGKTMYIHGAQDVCPRCGCCDWAEAINTQRLA